MSLNKESIASAFKELQLEIVKGLETLDGGNAFRWQNWERPEGGGGTSTILENGSLIEKGGVNWSAVFGETPAFL